MPEDAAAKQLMVLGLLSERPMYGQQLYEVIAAHHDVVAAQLKKPAMYYQLDRLLAGGYLRIDEVVLDAPLPGRGHLGSAPQARTVYSVTEQGRARFAALLRQVLTAYPSPMGGLDVGLFFLDVLPPGEAVGLLEQRQAAVRALRENLTRQLAGPADQPGAAHDLVGDHARTLLDAELAWLERTLTRLRHATGGTAASAVGSGS